MHYALLTPGAVIDHGEIAVGAGGKFQYVFDPQAVHAKVPLYDIISITTGKPQIGRVIHLTFFAEEKGPAGSFFDVARVILRGTTALTARALIPAAPTALVPVDGVGWDAASVRQAAAGGQGVAPGGQVTGIGAQADANPVTTIAATEVADIRTWDSVLDGMVRAGDLVAVSRRDDPEHAGRVHERLQQHHLGVPVFGGEVTRQVERGSTISIFGRLHLAVSIEADPSLAIDAAQAVSIAAERTGGRPPEDQTAALVVLPLDQGGYRLAWRTRTETEEGRRDCFVDAESAAVLLTYGLPEERRASGRIVSIPLIPRHESGALLAALEDVAAVKQAAPRPETWRSPSRYGLPDHYSGRRAAAADDAIEANAAIVGHVFYLATEGGTNRVSGLTVEGMGRAGGERVSQAFLRAAALLLPADSTFALARLATAQAARDLYGKGGAVERVIEAAWEAVGVR